MEVVIRLSSPRGAAVLVFRVLWAFRFLLIWLLAYFRPNHQNVERAPCIFAGNRIILIKTIMARSKGGLRGLSGLLGPVILKQYADKTVITSRPDMKRVKRTKKQKMNSSRFALAVAYAKAILADSNKRREFAGTLKKGESVYHCAVRQYLLQIK